MPRAASACDVNCASEHRSETSARKTAIDAINVERDEAKEAADDKAGGRPRKATRQII